MMTTALVGGWFMLVFCGLWTGGIMIFAVERTYQWRLMTIEQYSVDFRRSVLRVDPLMPILGIICCAGAIAFALHRSGIAALLAWTTLGLIVLVIAATIMIAEPINSRFRRLPEGQVPEGAEQLQVTWRRFHLWRTVFAVGALGCASAATLV